MDTEKKKKNKKKKIDKYTLIIIILLVIIFFVVCVLIVNHNKNVKDNTYTITLLGENPISIYEGEEYIEPGFSSKDINNKDTTNLVQVINNVNNNKVGEYEIIYQINNEYKKNVVKRKVNVLNNPIDIINFKLLGNNKVSLNKNDKYEEIGFEATLNNEDFSKKVSVTNNIDTSLVGVFEIKYLLTIGNKTKELTREVEVIGNKYEVSFSDDKLTNQDIIITLTNSFNNFQYFKDPKGETTTDNALTYSISENGVYTFYLVDKNDASEQINIEIKNIDKKAPTGNCEAKISDNTTNFYLNGQDENGILKYVYNNIEYSKNFTVNGKYENNEVTIYDNAGNNTKMMCDTYYDDIKSANQNIVASFNSESLKYWIEKPNSLYTISHIWARDPYGQMKTAIPNSFGTLDTTKNILEKEINSNSYQNKGLIAVNASGFTSKDFDSYYFKKIPGYKNTSLAPIVIVNGKILRDFTDQLLPFERIMTYGLKKDGYLAYYDFKKDSISFNQQLKEKIISDGVKYTIGFTPVLVENGQVAVSNSSPNLRQAICQINKNNFIIVTNTTSNRNQGLGFLGTAKLMKQLNCRIGLNLDGGGSINMFYKGNNSTISSIKTSSRQVADILYFVEK